jgi:hypothetical protein
MRSLVKELQERVADPRRAADCAINEPRRPPAPISADQLGRVEQLLGFGLPEMLRALYLEVGNGGFGPGYGLLDLPTGAPGCADLIGTYWYLCEDPRAPNPDQFFDPSAVAPLPESSETDDRSDDHEAYDHDVGAAPAWNWPPRLLPIFFHGCGIYECIDWTQPHAPMVLHDPDFFEPGRDMTATFAELAPSLEHRLNAWLAGDDLTRKAKAKLERRG